MIPFRAALRHLDDEESVMVVGFLADHDVPRAIVVHVDGSLTWEFISLLRVLSDTEVPTGVPRLMQPIRALA